MNKSKQTKSVKRFLTMAGLVLITVASTQLHAQNGVGINFIGAAAHPSAALDVASTNKGFLPPRMTATQRNGIVNAANGLVVFCTNCGTNGGELQVYSGGIWRNMVGGNAATTIAIGESYGGGKIAYILQPGDPGYNANLPHGLIAAPTDQGTATWGCYYGTAIAGADGTSIGTGNQNTIDIMNGCAETGAARICGDLLLNGYSDWYLPSKDELYKLYLNIGPGAPAPNTNIGGFVNASYWSSTESGSGGYAWLFGFEFGNSYDLHKYYTNYVRAVRAF